MKIIELEGKTGLDRATIRYYEKECLIKPVRLENGYRDYTEADADHLLKIKLMRQLGMSLERIKNLQQGSEDFSTALADQLSILDKKIDNTRQAKAVCQDMLNDGVRYDTLDSALYLARLSEAPVSSAPTETAAYHEPAVRAPYHPFRRYAARAIDYFLLRSLLMFIIVVILRIRPYEDPIEGLISYGAPFLAVPLMALSLYFLETTPGKWLMGLSVYHYSGRKLSFAEAMEREWEVLKKGYGFGIPFWSLYRLYKSYRSYRDGQALAWDYQSEYYCQYPNRRRKTVLVAVALVMILLNTVCFLDLTKPVYRGDLTISEFASNYNDYLDMLEISSGRLNEDGTWLKTSSNTPGAVIIIGSNAEINDFVYTTEGETITRIRSHEKWTDIFAVTPLGSRVELAAITMLMSQQSTNIFDLRAFGNMWKEAADQASGSFTYKNIEIRWEISSINCIVSSGSYWTDDSEKESSVELDCEIIIH